MLKTIKEFIPTLIFYIFIFMTGFGLVKIYEYRVHHLEQQGQCTWDYHSDMCRK